MLPAVASVYHAAGGPNLCRKLRSKERRKPGPTFCICDILGMWKTGKNHGLIC